MEKSDIIVLLDLDDTLFDTETFINSDLKTFQLFEEVHDTLIQLAKIATLGIFSQGEIAFQNKKLQETNIKEYFASEHVHVVEYKLDVMKEILGQYKNSKVFFIDDRLENLRLGKKSVPSVFTIWMKRGRYADLQKEHAEFTPDAVIEKLQDILPLIISK